MEILSNSEFWSKNCEFIESAQSIEPVNALTAIESFDIVIPFVLKNDDIEKIYIELKKDFEWLDSFYYKLERGLDESLNIEEVEELVGVCKWIINTTNDWTKESDPYFKNIAVCLIIIAWLNTNIWMYIKSDIDNTCLINDLISQIINFNFHLATRNGMNIWEKEAIDNMNLAIEQRNWQDIANNWSVFKSLGFQEYKYVFVKEIFQFANIFSQDKILDTMKSSNDFLLMNIIFERDTFSIDDRLLLALNTTNNLFRFALLFSLELEKLVLSNEQEVLMAKILSNISIEVETAKDWFKIFNRYLIRFSFFSSAFGRFLADYASEEDIDIYLNSLGDKGFCQSISNSYSNDRSILTKTFERFDSLASAERKVVLWSKIYAKYIEQGLLNHDGIDYMNDVSYSVFDYAVVSYFVECIDIKTLENECAKINQDLTDINSSWAKSEIDIRSKFYNSFALLQPIYHAGFVLEGKAQKLQKLGSYYVPPQIINDKKTCLMFNLVLDR